MYQKQHLHKTSKWRQRLHTMYLLGVMCLTLICIEGIAGSALTAYADGGPGGNFSDPSIRAVDIAEPAVVRIITQIEATLIVNLGTGQAMTFPLTPQHGFNGYVWDLSGSGAFVSAHGDILTADHVVNPPKADLNQQLDQVASTDIANYINQKTNQTVTADQVFQELASNQIPSTPHYQPFASEVFLSTSFSGALTAASFQT